MEIENKEQILQRRKEIEKELLEMLKETKSDFGLDEIKEISTNFTTGVSDIRHFCHISEKW